MNASSKTLAIGVLLGAVVAGAILALYIPQLPRGGQAGTSSAVASSSLPPYTNLPAGCVKPPNGFLIIADINGFNDSIEHGAPANRWPIITVKQGATVNITVCNLDHQAHGFQVTHYFDSNIETVEPGQVIHVTFVADRAGTFYIYCSIFCSIHIYMQSGELNVTAS